MRRSYATSAAGFLLWSIACGATPAAQLPPDHPPVGAGAGTSARLPPGTVLAKVGDESITVAELDAAILAVGSPERLEYVTAGPVREMLESLADRKLMAREARRLGLDRNPAVRERLAKPAPGADILPEQILAEAWLERELNKVSAPTDAEVAGYYHEHPAEFTIPARMLATRLVAATSAAAETLRADLARGTTLDDLRSRQAARLLSGDSLWIQEGPTRTDMSRIAFTLKPGQVSRAFRVATGFAVLRAEKITPARLRPFAEVRAGIAANLQGHRREIALAEVRRNLRKTASVVIDKATFSSYLAAVRGAN